MKRLSKLIILAAILLALLVAYLIITMVSNRSDDHSDDDETTTGDQINTSYTAAQIDISTLYAIKYNVLDAE